MRFSDPPLFLIDSTEHEFMAVFKNSYRSLKVVDEKESSTDKLLATSGFVCLQPKVCKYCNS